MRVNEGRRDQPAPGVDDAACVRLDAAFNRDDAAVLAGDVEALAAVGQAGVPDEEIKSHGRRTGPCWVADKA